MKRLLREPLFHFLLIGGTLFALHATLNGVRPPSVTSARIEITKGDADQLRQAWQMQWKCPPTTDELDGLIAGEIRERILSKEAMKLGLDQDDPIVRRRLAQKLEFLLQDVRNVAGADGRRAGRVLRKSSHGLHGPGSRHILSHLFQRREAR